MRDNTGTYRQSDGSTFSWRCYCGCRGGNWGSERSAREAYDRHLDRIHGEKDGIITKTIIAEDARTELSDALADLLHVHAGDMSAVYDVITEVMPSAVGNYEVEVAGTDGTRTVVVADPSAERYFAAVGEMDKEWAPYVEALTEGGRGGGLDQTGGMVFCLRVDLEDGSYLYAAPGSGMPRKRSELDVEFHWGWSYYDAEGEYTDRSGTFGWGGDTPKMLAAALVGVAVAIEAGEVPASEEREENHE